LEAAGDCFDSKGATHLLVFFVELIDYLAGFLDSGCAGNFCEFAGVDRFVGSEEDRFDNAGGGDFDIGEVFQVVSGGGVVLILFDLVNNL
jgi:hypothetical protein